MDVDVQPDPDDSGGETTQRTHLNAVSERETASDQIADRTAGCGDASSSKWKKRPPKPLRSSVSAHALPVHTAAKEEVFLNGDGGQQNSASQRETATNQGARRTEGCGDASSSRRKRPPPKPLRSFSAGVLPIHTLSTSVVLDALKTTTGSSYLTEDLCTTELRGALAQTEASDTAARHEMVLDGHGEKQKGGQEGIEAISRETLPPPKPSRSRSLRPKKPIHTRRSMPSALHSEEDQLLERQAPLTRSRSTSVGASSRSRRVNPIQKPPRRGTLADSNLPPTRLKKNLPTENPEVQEESGNEYHNRYLNWSACPPTPDLYEADESEFVLGDASLVRTSSGCSQSPLDAVDYTLRGVGLDTQHKAEPVYDGTPASLPTFSDDSLDVFKRPQPMCAAASTLHTPPPTHRSRSASTSSALSGQKVGSFTPQRQSDSVERQRPSSRDRGVASSKLKRSSSIAAFRGGLFLNLKTVIKQSEPEGIGKSKVVQKSTSAEFEHKSRFEFGHSLQEQCEGDESPHAPAQAGLTRKRSQSSLRRIRSAIGGLSLKNRK